MSVQVQRRGAVATIVLDRPQAMNAVDAELGDQLLAALREVAQDDGVRAVVLTGSGRAFSSGADLRAGFEPNESGRPNLQKALNERFHPIILTIREMPKPVVAAVNGAAAGIGCSFALACDLIVAAESSYFLLAFVNIGLVADGGSSLLIPERIGFARAAEMAMLGERVPAPKALEWGLINFVVTDETLMSEADRLADRLAAGPTRSYAGTKRQLNAWQFARMQAQLELEAEIQQEMAQSHDFLEGVGAFVEKRTANFEGR
ncbi:enoyl-CoA hydratase-related protein [Solirubrobacter ginsenosidimutans]|uniref:Enoyl-CoA hydratase-related protein n=1 Tax=Solirubrobacter ginsenosidimutans TaxID=490573 RepID=A0A9X3S4D0_9ACTN|nr:enoyl-CoA hydratase-related protein [Solirubrobacter ginsenosidimutans]MDA0160498.1 enoyl-CoA hydratase-related protein [Solirubrobacter ginsenosidimutans]